MAISKMLAIKKFFESGPHGREVRREELIALSKDKDAYQSLAEDCAKALGETLGPSK